MRKHNSLSCPQVCVRIASINIDHTIASFDCNIGNIGNMVRLEYVDNFFIGTAKIEIVTPNVLAERNLLYLFLSSEHFYLWLIHFAIVQTRRTAQCYHENEAKCFYTHTLCLIQYLSKYIKLNIIQRINNNSIRMGCQAISPYEQQTTGAIDYPAEVAKDLYDRNSRVSVTVKQTTIPSPHYVMGYNQSFVQAKIFSYVLNKKQYIVFPAGRFIVVTQSASRSQKNIMMEEVIIDMDMRGKLCLTALIKGRLKVWDLQFYEVKINIQIPSIQSMSSVSLTDKYIFCTDIGVDQFIYCYDMRTTKLKAKQLINSTQFILKGTSWNSNQHVTVGADGIWFSTYSEANNEIQVIKGLFGSFPKTSMACVKAVNQKYVVSGSIDGYVFLWAFNKCQRVLKVVEGCITEMLVCNSKLVISSLRGDVKIIDYNIKQKPKQDSKQNQTNQITQDFMYTLAESYVKQPLQAIVSSKINQHLYYSQTRFGQLFSRMLPTPITQSSKINHFNYNNNNIITQFDSRGDKFIYKDTIWFVRSTRGKFMLKQIIMQGQPENWRIKTNYVANSKNHIENSRVQIFAFMPTFFQVYYAVQNLLYRSQVAQPSQTFAIQDMKVQKVFQLQQKQEITQLFFIQTANNPYLAIFSQNRYRILKLQKCNSKLISTQNINKKIANLIFTLDDVQFNFTQRNQKFKLLSQKIDEQKINQLSSLHNLKKVQNIKILSSYKQISWNNDFSLVGSI